jgi:curli biogenesis system outer membrane secretion channel CsgG
MNIKRVLILLAVAATSAFGQQLKKTMSVDNFDYSAVMTSVQAIFGTQQNIGVGINAMMTRRVQQDGRFAIVERRKVNEVMSEQDFSASNRVKRGTGPRVGQIRGAELTLMGDIVVFGRDDRRKSGVAGAIVPGAGGIAGGYRSDNKAVVVLDYRIVDVETSEVVATGEARGESKRSSSGFGAALIAGMVGAGGAVNMTSSNFADTIIGEATMDAVDKLAQQIRTVNISGGAADRSLDVDARIADVSGSIITINAGLGAGLQAGQVFTVYHKGREIKDPSTGEVLDVQTTPIGQITLTTVRDRISIGNYTGSAPPVVGDVVRK